MGRGGIGPEVLPPVWPEQAQAELITAAKRFEYTRHGRTDRYRLNRHPWALFACDAQRTAITWGMSETLQDGPANQDTTARCGGCDMDRGLTKGVGMMTNDIDSILNSILFGLAPVDLRLSTRWQHQLRQCSGTQDLKGWDSINDGIVVVVRLTAGCGAVNFHVMELEPTYRTTLQLLNEGTFAQVSACGHRHDKTARHCVAD
jgi:hypothetical protein